MKKYSRKALIAYFKKLPPRSKPCKEHCPIATMLGMRSSASAARKDPKLANIIDYYAWSTRGLSWQELTASRIVKIAESLEK